MKLRTGLSNSNIRVDQAKANADFDLSNFGLCFYIFRAFNPCLSLSLVSIAALAPAFEIGASPIACATYLDVPPLAWIRADHNFNRTRRP